MKVSARARCRWHLSCAARVGVGTSAVQHVSSSAPQLCSSRFRRWHFSCAAIRIVVGTAAVQQYVSSSSAPVRPGTSLSLECSSFKNKKKGRKKD